MQATWPFQGAFLPRVTVLVSRPVLAGPSLGRTNQEWYERAKRKVAEFDSVAERARRIANSAVREDVLGRFVGDPGDASGALYRRNSVADDIAEAESYSPVNVMVFAQSRTQNRVDELDEWYESFHQAVKAAEQTYGILPEPVTIREIAQSPLTVPILVGAGIVAIALLWR